MQHQEVSDVWGRLDYSYTRHPKIERAGPLGMVLHLRCIGHAGEFLTDGLVPASVVTRLAADINGPETIQRCLDARLLHVLTGGDYEVHDFLDWNSSKEEVEAARKKEAERKRTKRRKGASTPDTHPDSTTDAHTESTPESGGIDVDVDKDLSASRSSDPAPKRKLISEQAGLLGGLARAWRTMYEREPSWERGEIIALNKLAALHGPTDVAERFGRYLTIPESRHGMFKGHPLKTFVRGGVFDECLPPKEPAPALREKPGERTRFFREAQDIDDGLCFCCRKDVHMRECICSGGRNIDCPKYHCITHCPGGCAEEAKQA